MSNSELTIPGATWYAYLPDSGYETHETEKEAREAAESACELDPGDEWPEDQTAVEWGIMIPFGEAEAFDRTDPPEDSEWTDVLSYRIAPTTGCDILVAMDDRVREADARVEAHRVEIRRLIDKVIAMRQANPAEELLESARAIIEFTRAHFEGGTGEEADIEESCEQWLIEHRGRYEP